MPGRIEVRVGRPGGRTDRQQHVVDAAAQARDGDAAGGEQCGGADRGVGAAAGARTGTRTGTRTGSGALRGGFEDREGAEVHRVGGGFDPPEGEVERRKVLGDHLVPLVRW